jgi:hypothetical protein
MFEMAANQLLISGQTAFPEFNILETCLGDLSLTESRLTLGLQAMLAYWIAEPTRLQHVSTSNQFLNLLPTAAASTVA